MARNEIVRRAIRERGPVLDIGCGRGIVVEYLRRHGIDARGVELGPVVPISTHVRASTDAFELPVDERARVKTILLLDVLEHLEDPASFLQRIIVGFPEAKEVIVAVPARPELWSNHDEFYGHYRRYTLPMLQDLGMPIRESRYFFRALYPLMWVMAKLKVKRDVALKAPSGSMHWLHRLVGRVFVLEERLLPRRIPGSSIIAALTRYPS